MKKIAFILALLIVTSLVLVACGEEENSSEAVSEATSAEESVEESTEESIEESIEESSEEVSEESEEASGKFKPATVNGSVYESEFFGVKIEFPEEFMVFTPEELKKTDGFPTDLEALENGTANFFDLYALTTAAGHNVNGIVSKSDEDIAGSFDLIKKELLDSFKQAGMDVKSCVESEIYIAGGTAPALEYEYIYSGAELFGFQTYIQKDGYFICYTLTALDKDTLIDMIMMITD